MNCVKVAAHEQGISIHCYGGSDTEDSCHSCRGKNTQASDGLTAESNISKQTRLQRTPLSPTAWLDTKHTEQKYVAITHKKR